MMLLKTRMNTFTRYSGWNSSVAIEWLMTATVFFLVFTVTNAVAAPNPKDIMTKNEEARKVQDLVSTAKLTTGGGGTPEKVKEFSWWRKLTSDQNRFNTLTRFHSPAEVKGEGILFLEHSDDQSDVMLYLPNFKKVRRVENQQQSGSFMGSEFSYSDISSPHVDNYSYTYLKEEACPTPEAKAVKCHVIESLPATEAIKARTGYAKTVQWIREDNSMGVQMEAYNLEGRLIKRTLANQIKQIDSAKNKWLAHNVRVENLTNQKYTVLEFSEVKANQGVKDAIFTQQNLSRP